MLVMQISRLLSILMMWLMSFDVRAEDEFARVELLVSLKQELERLSPRELMIIRTYLDYPIEVVARKLKVRPNTISKARRKIARELRKKLV